MNTDQQRVAELIEQLGTMTATQIAEHVARTRTTGRRHTITDDAVVNYLERTTGLRPYAACPAFIMVPATVDDWGHVEKIPTPPSVRMFMYAFDAGVYPVLVRQIPHRRAALIPPPP